MVGISPSDFGSILAADMGSLVKRAAFAYLFIGVADFAWQKRRTEKSMKMDKQEIKRRGQGPEPPGRGAMRDPPPPDGGLAQAHDGRRPDRGRRRHQPDALLRRAAVRHGRADAPEVVAKGKDLIALRIRELAAEHGVPVIPDPPLARGLLRVGRGRPPDPRGVLRRRRRTSSPSSTARRPGGLPA